MFRQKSWVEYGVSKELEGLVSPILKAEKCIPHEYSSLPRWQDGKIQVDKSKMTLKGCMPFFDAMTEGLIIPFPFDVVIESFGNGSEVAWWWTGNKRDSFQPEVSYHPAEQVGEMAKNRVLKIASPYYVKTSPDILAFYGPLVNRKASLVPFSGIVNHGDNGYRNKIHIICEWQGEDGLHRFSAGEPLAQLYFVPRVLPKLKQRVFFKSEIKEGDRQEFEASLSSRVYKNRWRAKRR